MKQSAIIGRQGASRQVNLRPTHQSDFDLSPDNLVLPAARDGSTAARTEYFASPWYLALAQQSPDQQESLKRRIYTLTAACTPPQALSAGAFGLCDMAGNYTTVD